MHAQKDDSSDKKSSSSGSSSSSSDKKKSGGGSGGGSGAPVMRNLHHTMSMKNLYTAVGLAGTGAFLFYLLWNRKRRYTYSEFYRKYDADASFDRMMNANVLNSCPPGSSSDGKKK